MSNKDIFYIAVDGGASKTEYLVYNIEDKSTKHFFSGGINYKNSEEEARINILDKGIYYIHEQMNIPPEEIKGIVMGLAGCDAPSDIEYFKDLMANTYIPAKKVYICNDAELAFYAGGTPPGLCINAGTGSIATGVAKDGRKSRSAGWGINISDAGSGTWVAINVIRDLLKYCDGYGKYEEVFEDIRLYMDEPEYKDIPAIISQNIMDVKVLAGFAKPIMDKALEGDPYTSNIVKEGSILTAEIAYSIYEKLNFKDEEKIDLVKNGSLFKNKLYNENFDKYFYKSVPINNINLCQMTKSPVMGGINLAHILYD